MTTRDYSDKQEQHIAKVIEVTEAEDDNTIDNIIYRKCKEENGLNYIYTKEDVMKKNGLESLFDEM